MRTDRTTFGTTKIGRCDPQLFGTSLDNVTTYGNQFADQRCFDISHRDLWFDAHEAYHKLRMIKELIENGSTPLGPFIVGVGVMVVGVRPWRVLLPLLLFQQLHVPQSKNQSKCTRYCRQRLIGDVMQKCSKRMTPYKVGSPFLPIELVGVEIGQELCMRQNQYASTVWQYCGCGCGSGNNSPTSPAPARV